MHAGLPAASCTHPSPAAATSPASQPGHRTRTPLQCAALRTCLSPPCLCRLEGRLALPSVLIEASCSSQ
jgi:hypothetical protein